MNNNTYKKKWSVATNSNFLMSISLQHIARKFQDGFQKFKCKYLFSASDLQKVNLYNKTRHSYILHMLPIAGQTAGLI